MLEKISKPDLEVIAQIAKRAVQRGYYDESPNPYVTAILDLANAHSTIPLDLAALLAFPPLDFSHDIVGIIEHIDRDTGKLTGCFVPRCALPQ